MTLLPARVWADEEWERIKLGYRARSMDEKWNVFVDGNVAFLHRSWTGHAVFEATFSRVDRGWRISAAVAESHPKRAAKVSPQLNRVLLELVLSAIVLGEPGADLRAELVLLSRPDDHPAPPEGLIEHSILGLRSEP
jgi:hypothetical protein